MIVTLRSIVALVFLAHDESFELPYHVFDLRYFHDTDHDTNSMVQPYSRKMIHIRFNGNKKQPLIRIFTNLSSRLPAYLVNFWPVCWWIKGAPAPGRPHGSYKFCWGIILNTCWGSLFGSRETDSKGVSFPRSRTYQTRWMDHVHRPWVAERFLIMVLNAMSFD